MTGKICPICGKGQLTERSGSYETKFVDRSGSEQPLVLPEVRRLQCDSCKEEILDDAATRQITEARRKSMGLLSAAEIRDLRLRFGKTQVQMSKFLGVGEKTYCRWESGSFIQSVAFDNYLRLVRDLPDASTILSFLELGGSAQPESTALLDNTEFAFLDDFGEVRQSAGIFTELMNSGMLHVPIERLR